MAKGESFREYTRRLFSQTEAIVGGLIALAVVSAVLWLFDANELSPRMTFILTMLAICWASFEVFHETRQEREHQRAKVRKFEEGSPSLRVIAQKFVPLTVDKRTFMYRALQVWISNEPVNRNQHSVARNVTVHVKVYASGEVSPLVAHTTQWVDAYDPEQAAYKGAVKKIDIPPNDDPAKFFVLLNHAGEADCFVHTFSVLQGQPDGRVERLRLVPGEYRVVFQFRGENIEQEIEHRLISNGQEPELFGVAKKHTPVEAK